MADLQGALPIPGIVAAVAGPGLLLAGGRPPCGQAAATPRVPNVTRTVRYGRELCPAEADSVGATVGAIGSDFLTRSCAAVLSVPECWPGGGVFRSLAARACAGDAVKDQT